MTESLALEGDTKPFIELRDVSRSFGATHAVRSVSLDLAVRGQVRALVGENGAGKSTVLGLAAGRLPVSSGDVLVNGQRMQFGTPREARGHGVRAIYQELTVIPALSPEANVFLGQQLSRAGWLREPEMRSEYVTLCQRLGVRPAASASRSGDLSVAEQQVLEILRAVASNARALLFDEPTAALAHEERAALFRTFTDLVQQDMAITFVSHDLDEVLAHSDFVTVMRDGAVVGHRATREWTKRGLISAMLGDDRRGELVARGNRRTTRSPSVARPTVLRVRGLATGRGGILDFDLKKGEILGIAGLVGSGRTSLLRALAGLNRTAAGTVQTPDGVTRVPKSVREARRRGISLLPENRKDQGLVLARTAAENVVLGEWRRAAVLGFASDRAVEEVAATPVERVRFQRRRLSDSVRALSGGNQQKLMLARWLLTDHEILLADEPTRGVDIGAKGEILVALEQIVSAGRSVILVSSELEEVVGLSDRILVLNAGNLISTLDSESGALDSNVVLSIMFETTPVPAAARPNGGTP